MADFLIIGGGVPGLLLAFYLQQQGAAVLVADSGNPSASRAGAAILSPLPPWQAAPAARRLAAAGAAAYPAILAQLGDDCGYQKSGMLVLPPYDRAALAAWQQADAVPAAAMRHRADGALFLPQAASVHPRRLMRALRRHIRRRAAVVTRLHTSGAGAVAAALQDGGELRAGAFIICAGAWTPALCPPPAPAIKPIRGDMLLYRPPARTRFTLPAKIVLRGDCYLHAGVNGQIIAGSTLRDVGFDARAGVPGARGENSINRLMQQAAAMLPALRGIRPRACWAGLRPCAPAPIIARHPVFKNVYINSGHCRYGLTMAPAAARHMETVISGATDEAANPYPYQRAQNAGEAGGV